MVWVFTTGFLMGLIVGFGLAVYAHSLEPRGSGDTSPPTSKGGARK